MNNHPTVIITGSSGLVGSALVSYFAQQGFHVRALQRVVPHSGDPRVSYYPFDLADVRDRGFEGADYIIHCAYQPVVSLWERLSGTSTDVEGTKKIISLARKYDSKMIFLSTLSAHADAKSYYARQKLLAEKLFDAQKDLILKLGIVIGRGGGLFGRIAKSLKNHKIVPLIGAGHQQTQIIALDDLCRIVATGMQRNITGVFKISHPTAITTKELYQKIARSVDAHPFFVPVPWGFAYVCARFAEHIGARLPFTAENILGLRDLRVFNTIGDLKVFGIRLKDCQESLDWYAR